MDSVILIAAGDGTRWKNHLDVPKHLAPIRGEPLIHRTQRQLSERDITPHVVTLDSALVTSGRWFVPPLKPRHGDADKFLSSAALWGEHTAVLYGDVIFTDEALDAILSHEGDWKLYARPHGSKIKPFGECFAQCFTDHGEHLRALRAIVLLRSAGAITRNGGWEHYWQMCGVPTLDWWGTDLPRDRMAVIDDATEDIDYPIDWDRWTEVYA